MRSIFEVHRISEVFARIVDRARQVLGTEVHVHRSRVNYGPGSEGKKFPWHSVFLTDDYSFNGPLMIMPSSQHQYISCAGETPQDDHRTSLVMQGAGTPGRETLTGFAEQYGTDVLEGEAGGATMFDSNCMHASNGNVAPFPGPTSSPSSTASTTSADSPRPPSHRARSSSAHAASAPPAATDQHEGSAFVTAPPSARVLEQLGHHVDQHTTLHTHQRWGALLDPGTSECAHACDDSPGDSNHPMAGCIRCCSRPLGR